MLVLLSPAKKLDFEPVDKGFSDPAFQDDAIKLAKAANKLSVKGLKDLMKISDDLAKLNKERFKAFAEEPDEQATKQAMFAFAGDTYQGLEAESFTMADIAYAQNHLRILSGLYGILRPLDRIQPYRLEMGSSLKTAKAKTLYSYWGERLAEELDKTSKGLVINCASVEYFKAAKEKKMTSRVITPSFKEERDGKLKMIGFFAKKARGAMARYIIQNRIEDPDDLQGFDLDGYRFRADLSNEDAPVFTRAGD